MLFMDDLLNAHKKSNDNSGLPVAAGYAPAYGLGAMMSGGGEKSKRVENDFYPTPVEATRALIAAERGILDFFAWNKVTVWEPACGDGILAKELVDIGIDVHATDLIDRGYGLGGVDFLKCQSPIRTPIITNPPYEDFPEKFIRHAIRLGCPYLVLLLKSNYFHSIGNGKLFDEHPPSREYRLTWRLDFLNKGRPTMTASWFVWDFMSPRKSSSPDVYILHKPKHYQPTNQKEMFT